MYVVFDVYIFILQRKGKTIALLLLDIMTIFSILFCILTIHKTFSIISIPVFTIGVISSLCKERSNVVWTHTIVYTLFMTYFIYVWDSAYALQTFLNWLFILIFLFIFSKWSVDIKTKQSSIVGIVSFDIYLVHNKVLTVLKCSDVNMNICSYCMWVAIFTCFFYFLRKSLKI